VPTIELLLWSRLLFQLPTNELLLLSLFE